MFIADHTGLLATQSAFLRPINIGAASGIGQMRGPEPDDIHPGNISSSKSHADLRLFHYVRSNWIDRCEYVALMQYRRMYFFGSPPPMMIRLWALKMRSATINVSQVNADASVRDEYLTFLASQSDQVLARELAHSDIVANKISFAQRCVQDQYIEAIKKLYPGEVAYVDAWYDMRRLLEQKIGKVLTSECLDGHYGFFNNCILTKWNLFIDYYDFLFELLDKLSAYQDCFRLYGYLAERVLHPWIASSGLKVRSKSIIFFQ